MRLIIRNVDMDGFCGRDYHPKAADVGRVGQVVNAEWDEPDGAEGEGIVIFTCRMLDTGELLELVEYEVAFIGRVVAEPPGPIAPAWRSTRDGDPFTGRLMRAWQTSDGQLVAELETASGRCSRLFDGGDIEPVL